MKTTEAAAQFCEDFIEAMNSHKQQKWPAPINTGFISRASLDALDGEAVALARLRRYLDAAVLPDGQLQALASLSTVVTAVVASYYRPVTTLEISGRLQMLGFTGPRGSCGYFTDLHFLRAYLAVERPVTHPSAPYMVRIVAAKQHDSWEITRADHPVSPKPSTKKLARVTTGKRATARRTRPMLG